MSLVPLRRALGRLRRKVHVRLVGNDVSFTINSKNRKYHAKAQGVWAAAPRPPLSPSVPAWANQLERDGYVQFSPEGAKSAFFEALNAEVERHFAEPASSITPIDGAIRLKDGVNRVSAICDVINSDISQTVEAYFKSHFKVYWAQIYRTVPSPHSPDASFLWHVDNAPPHVMKLMVYLTDTSKESGALRLKPRPFSDQLLGEGFWDRSNAARFSSRLNDESTTKVFEGGKGTAILFLNWACIHRAAHPTVGYRDVVVFDLIPSIEPWNEHLKRNRRHLSQRDSDVCPDPALF